MDLSEVFRPLDKAVLPRKSGLEPAGLAESTSFHHETFPDWHKAEVVVIGCDEDRGAANGRGAAFAPDMIRKELYALSKPGETLRLADLGNLNRPAHLGDYYALLADVTEEIVKTGKLLILLGGSQDLVYGQYRGYRHLDKEIEYVNIDSELDVRDSDLGLNNFSVNHKIFTHSPRFLFNHVNLGHQSYYVTLADRKRLKNLHFPSFRLGALRQNLRQSEPFLRNADMVSLDMSCVRAGESPAGSHAGPAGFTVEEISKLAHYAGMGNRITSFSLCEIKPILDRGAQSVQLGAIVLWYLLQGYANRRVDEPTDLRKLTKYRCALHGGIQEIIFYKNEQTERWWMAVPYHEGTGISPDKYRLVPCSEQDYEIAREDEIPERWWETHHKLKGKS